MNTFLKIPEFIWNNIFVLLNTLVCGLIVAIFTSTFLKKKEERTRVSGVILERRIESERKMLAFLENKLTKNQLISSDEHINEYINSLLINQNIPITLQYSTVFSNKNNFDSFYKEFDERFSEDKLWYDEKVRDHILLMIGYFSWINVIPIVISKIELPNNKKITEREFNQACDKCFLLYGLLLDNEINALIADLDTKVVNSIYKLNLSSPKKGLGRNGMLNSSTKRIIKQLRNRTLLGIDWPILISLVIEITLVTCKIDLSKLSDEELDKITKRVEEINYYE